jgi:hypothetical protein
MTKSRDLANAATALNAVTATELGFVDGVTSAIQTQMDAKLATATAATTYVANSLADAKGDLFVASADNTVTRLPVGNSGEQIVADSSTATGLSYQGNYAAGKNKFINGNMAIAQRGAAAVTLAAGARFFSVDRTFGQLSGGVGIFSVEQVVDAPAAANAGQHSLKAVVTTADTSIAAGDHFFLGQIIEGFNFASFQFGTASAQTVTISFWVKSSITGTFGVSIRNGSSARSNVSTYTILAANTWEKKTVTFVGDTSGTWPQDNTSAARIEWTLSAGTDFQTATPNVWTASNDTTTASQTNWMATVSNTFQLTAIQIEAGSVATAFQTATGTIQGELAACQRYYQRWTASTTGYLVNGFGPAYSTTAISGTIAGLQPMRVKPTAIDFSNLSVEDNVGSPVAITNATITTSSSNQVVNILATGASGLTQYRMYQIIGGTGGGYLGLSAEL